MLRIRFSRTGKHAQPSFRIVVVEKKSSVKGRYLEILGNYLIAAKPKSVTVNKDRISYWISKGAIPTDTVASLLKKEGMQNMDRYLEPRNLKRKKKGETVEEKLAPAGAQPTAATSAPAPQPAEPAKT